MPLIRVPGHHFDAPVDHADGRRGHLLVSGAVAMSPLNAVGLTGKGRSPLSHTRAVASVNGWHSGSATPARARGRFRSTDARTRSSRAGPLKASGQTEDRNGYPRQGGVG
jgi:hypothetical protein